MDEWLARCMSRKALKIKNRGTSSDLHLLAQLMHSKVTEGKELTLIYKIKLVIATKRQSVSSCPLSTVRHEMTQLPIVESD